MMILGALIGDYFGSCYEWKMTRTKDYHFKLATGYERFTDDSILTIALIDALLDYREKKTDDLNVLSNLARDKMVEYGKSPDYYGPCFGKHFLAWLDNPVPYESFGNGAAMRISGVGYIAKSLEETKTFSRVVTDVSHNCPSAETAAECVATSIFLLRHGKTVSDIHKNILHYYPNIDSYNIEEIRPTYQKDTTCDGSVPIAMKCFLDAKSFEDSLRSTIAMGGDADTLAAICCSMSCLVYDVPDSLLKIVQSKLDARFKTQINRLEKYLNNPD
jgi:ADP-ribosylglycohydrolase